MIAGIGFDEDTDGGLGFTDGRDIFVALGDRDVGFGAGVPGFTDNLGAELFLFEVLLDFTKCLISSMQGAIEYQPALGEEAVHSLMMGIYPKELGNEVGFFPESRITLRDVSGAVSGLGPISVSIEDGHLEIAEFAAHCVCGRRTGVGVIGLGRG